MHSKLQTEDAIVRVNPRDCHDENSFLITKKDESACLRDYAPIITLENIYAIANS
ncbi:MAG: hypothetical protein KME32_04580 [Mojavia pulchra JT2-VF2]|uniref:Uncharacterized protein n=1 Tax=Mojavia pulchra JT2-VF2 TaxID=287848 RepID=A0A951PUF0_9NOST|nr:hypothetical protein [Mojavia pulchra JT2-VF2]